ncbi:MAG: DUF1772 domain-containing protein [Bacteroidota bacterium]
MKKILSYIAIIATSAFIGNMINIGLSYGVYWNALNAIEFMETFKVDFPLLLAPTAATLLPAFISTLAVFLLSRKKTKARKFWRYAFIGLLAINVFTAAYFLPLNLNFMNQTMEVGEVSEKLSNWLFFHWIRIGVSVGAAIFAINAFVNTELGE